MGGGGITLETRPSSSLGQSDEEVGTQRLGHLTGEPGADRVSGDAAHDLSDQVALGQGVVAGGRSGLPPRHLGGQRRDAELPIRQLLGGDRLLPTREARRVAHEVADLDGLLAALRELGPVGGHRRVEVQLLAVGQHQGAHEGHRLGGRPHVGQGVPFPRRALGLVHVPAPDVDHRLAVEVDGHRGSHIGARIETGRERLSHTIETRLAGTVHICHATAPFGSRRSPEHSATYAQDGWVCHCQAPFGAPTLKRDHEAAFRPAFRSAFRAAAIRLSAGAREADRTPQRADPHGATDPPSLHKATISRRSTTCSRGRRWPATCTGAPEIGAGRPSRCRRS